MMTDGTRRVKCPYCGESGMVEYDPAMKRWECQVCGRCFDGPAPER